MNLRNKLLISSFFTILIPMLIIGLYGAYLLYRNTEISQWEFLESIKKNIETEITEIENKYLVQAKELTDYDYLRNKVYVYSKYWDKMSESIIDYDLTSFKDFIEKKALLNNIETIAVYRKGISGFNYVSSVGPVDYLPDVLFQTDMSSNYRQVIYKRYYDGIYLRVVYPIFSNGRLVGLILLMKGYNDSYFSKYTSAYNIDIAVVSKGVAIFNSNRDTDEAVEQLIATIDRKSRVNFNSNTESYTAFIFSYHLGESAVGELVLYKERINVLFQSGFVVQKLLLLVIVCVMIPVVTFFIKEIRLIKAINSIVDATENVSRGNYNSQVEINSNDEIGILSRNFNLMVMALKKNKNELQTQNMELAQKNIYIDAVFQSLQINIIIVDKQNKIQVVSKNTKSRLELSEEQIGKKIFDVPPFNNKKDIIENTIKQIWNDREFRRLYSIQFGSTSYEIDFYPVSEEDNEINAVVIILNNITERMEMERALVRSDRLASVGQLAAGLAHEINNPMSIILNHVQLLKSGKLSEEEEKRFMGRVEIEINRVSHLINNLLKFSREDISRLELISPEEIIKEVIFLFDPKAVFDSVNDLYGIVYKSKKVNIFLMNNQNVIKIFCARDSFKQIILNILKNSLESCGSMDGIIRISFRVLPVGVEINIADNGNGISESDLERVFDPFFSQQKSGKGTGLGLSLCRSMMHRFDGSINIDSTENSGTTVCLFFPVKENIHE